MNPSRMLRVAQLSHISAHQFEVGIQVPLAVRFLQRSTSFKSARTCIPLYDASLVRSQRDN